MTGNSVYIGHTFDALRLFNHSYLMGAVTNDKNIPPVYKHIRAKHAKDTVIIRAYNVFYEKNNDVKDQESLLIRFCKRFNIDRLTNLQIGVMTTVTRTADEPDMALFILTQMFIKKIS